MNANEKDFEAKLSELSEIYEHGKHFIYQTSFEKLSEKDSDTLMNLWMKMRDIAAVSMKSTHDISDN